MEEPEAALALTDEAAGGTTINGEKPPGPDTDLEGEADAVVRSGDGRKNRTKKWLLVGVTGMLLTLSAGIAARFLMVRQETSLKTSTINISAEPPQAAEQLPDFLVPLPASKENLVLRVSLVLHWSQEARSRFLQRQVSIRSEIYHRLGAIVASGMITKQGGGLESKQKVALEGELTRIFQRELGPRQLTVSVNEAVFL